MCAVPLVALTCVSVVLLVLAVSGRVTFEGDFKGDLYGAGTRILHGVSPYRPRLLAKQAAIVRAGGAVHAVVSPRYPAPALVAAAPLSLLPLRFAELAFFTVSVVSAVWALRLLGVRDWRCIAAACVSWPIVFGIWMGNISTLMLLGAALVWRWRARLWPAAVALASVVAAKLFLWPLGIWFVITRRLRVLALSVLLAVGAAAGGWGVIGFQHLKEYPQLLINVAVIGEGRGSSLVATLMSLGISPTVGRIVALALAMGLMVVAWRLAQLPDGDRRAFGLIAIVALIATPVAWAHYLILAFIPIALLSPGFSWLWFLPMAAGLAPTPVARPSLWASLPALTVEIVLVWRLCAPLLPRLTAGMIVRAEVAEVAEAGRRTGG